MLGQMVKIYFTRQGCNVVTFDERFSEYTWSMYHSFLKSLRNCIVINCVAKISSKASSYGDLLNANAILPLELRNSLEEDIYLVQPSSDGVFSGNKRDPYLLEDDRDAGDLYGWSKQLCENALVGRLNTLVTRVSIIGPTRGPTPKGFFSWVLAQKPGSKLKGYTNHFWNGITTLEWCKRVECFLIENNFPPENVIQFGTKEDCSKYDMLCLINEEYQRKLMIEPLQAEEFIDRRLNPGILSKSLKEQLTDLKAFNLLNVK